jgi:selenocysteine lyase/cysteine desulfurase
MQDPDAPTHLTRRSLLTSTLAGALATTLPSSALAQITEPPTTSRELWQWVRMQPVADSREGWMNTASIGPTLRSAMATEYRSREIQSGELPSFANGERWNQETQRLANRFGLFAGCDADEIVFTRGAGEALSFVANGLDLVSGDEVLTTHHEHPAALAPWLFQARRRGIVVKQFEMPRNASSGAELIQAVKAGLTERTRVLVLSHVQYADGTVLPVKEICQLARERNVISVFDGAQAFGMLNYQLRDLGCDFYAASFHKWLCGSHGSGMLYVRREMLERIWPSEPRGIDTSPPVITPTQAIGYEASPSAIRRFGNIVPQLWPALRGSEAALELHDRVNRARIEARVRELVLYARLRLQSVEGIQFMTPVAAGLWAGILTFRLPGRVTANVVNALARINRVHFAGLAWPTQSESSLRLSLHMINSHDEIDRMMQGFQHLPKL